jgi:hypothetical protein
VNALATERMLCGAILALTGKLISAP